MNGYELSRIWFDWCFVNPDKIKPNHSALYFFCIEHCNRLGWKDKFGLPTTMAMEALGIKSYNTYKQTLTDLVSWGFIKMVETSKNQYSANIVALSNFNKAVDKALDKALIKHASKQSESTGESIDSIDKQLTINKEPINKEQEQSYFFDRLLVFEILELFKFNETANFDKLQAIGDFHKCLFVQNRLEWFTENFKSYKQLKLLNPKYMHSFKNFLGDKEIHYTDGAWNLENWTEKLKLEKNGKTIKSANNSTGREEFGRL